MRPIRFEFRHHPVYEGRRVYGRIVSGPRKNAVEVFLYGRRNGFSMSPASLTSLGGPRRITASAIEDRSNGNAGWLFQLPDSWIAGGPVSIEARLGEQIGVV